ncbi:unnamed protein product [Paramecium pentaurelia]|uniref:Transmembrane protein n=1 Tax=Paramecium pentaurelia TaxID=43138 RepID=A0A8S1SVJ9_9CILI|nr:unnamed protein product [Paramecium pentaurelia]
MMELTQRFIEHYLDLMTSSPKIQLGESLFQSAIFLQFILRLHFIFPQDGWNVWKYGDYKLHVPYVILSFLYQEISDILKILLILFNVIIFIFSFFKVQFVFYYNNLLWNVFYIPQVAMLSSSSENIGISIFGIMLLFFILVFNLYFNRSTKFIHSNPFIRKFTQLTIISAALDTICYIDFEFHILQMILLHIQGIILCLDIIIFKPYRFQFNKIVFQYNFLFYTLVVIHTLLLFDKSEENMFYFSILLGTLAYALSFQLYDRYADMDSQNQYIILVQCQEFYQSQDIQQYLKLRQHQNKYLAQHQDQNKNEILICYLENNISINKKQKIDYEILELALIHFLCVHKAPLTALCRLKQYYNIPHDHSLFFRITFPSQHKQLWNSVTKVQDGINKLLKAGQYQDDRILSTKDIYEAVKIREISIPLILSTIDHKINYWKQLISLIANIKKLFQTTCQLSQKLLECQQVLQKLFNCTNIEQIEEPRTILEVLVLIIYYSIIINDHEQAIKMQKIMNDILRSESLIEGKLLNGNIMENKICLLYTSIVKSQGSIIKLNAQQIAQFWGYENEMDFRDIKHINQLMPDFLASVHDQYLERFKKLGHSILFGKSRTVFLKGKNNFYIPADITIDNFFISYDDYVITAAFSKTKEKCLFMLFDHKGRILGVNNLMFKLFQSIDKTITQENLASGYVFQLIPKIFNIINAYRNSEEELNQDDKIILKIGNPIKQQFSRLMQSSKGKNKHQLFYAGLWTTFDTPENYQKNQNQKSMLNLNLLDSQKPNCDLFDETYQQRMQQFIDHNIQTTNFQIKCYLEYLILGYQKSIPLFTLEINDIISAHDTENGETFSQNSLQNVELSDLNKSSHLMLSSIQDESFSKVKMEENEKLQQHPEISLMRGKYDQSFFDQLQESSRQILAPFSQRANFNLIKHKSMNDDSKYLEDEFKIIKLQQELGYDNQNYLQQYSKNKTVLDKLQDQQSSNNNNDQQIDQRNEMHAINSGGSIARRSRNHHYELLKMKSRSQTRPIQLSFIIFLDVCIILSIILFNILNIIFISEQRDNGNKQLLEIQAPYVFNGIYCELTSHDILYKLSKVEGIQISQNLLSNIQSRFKNLNYLQNMSLHQTAFHQIEQDFLKSNITLYYIDQADEFNSSYTFYYSKLTIYFRLLIKYYQDYNYTNFNDYFFQQSLFEVLNLENSTQLFRLLIRSLIDKFYIELDLNDELILNLFVIQTILQFCMFFLQFWFFFDLLKLHIKIMNLNCRLYEKDVYVTIQKLQSVREILNDKYSINWKKADYVHIIYQPLNKQQQINSTNTKQNKTTLLSSRIQQSTFNMCSISAFLFALLLIILIVNIGGFLFNSQKQKQLKPSYQLGAEFLHFTIQVDSIVSNAIRIKSQNILLSQNSLTESISPKVLQSSANYFKQDRYQNLTYFYNQVDSFKRSQIQIIQDLIKNPNIDSKNADILNQLFFQDICQLFCPISPDIKDNCTYLYNKGIIGIYTKIINFLMGSYYYELENKMLDTDFQNTLSLLNSADFNQMFGRHFTNAKLAFDQFAQENLKLAFGQIESNFNEALVYFMITGYFTLLAVGLALVYFSKVQQKQINLIRLSLTIIPVELIDQQAINILRQL